MFKILSNALKAGIQPSKQIITNQSNALYHFLSKIQIVPSISLVSTVRQQFLKPNTINQSQSCGFKVKGILRRRCKDCYFVMREQRLYVICKTHPRHKQMSMVPREKNTWTLVHATQGKIRPW